MSRIILIFWKILHPNTYICMCLCVLSLCPVSGRPLAINNSRGTERAFQRANAGISFIEMEVEQNY